MEAHVLVSWLVLAIAFAVLAKAADLFVDSTVSLANRFHIPRLVIGIVLVSLATTAPELSVSLIAALRGRPEMALGNAVGSVICDDGLALALCGIFTAGAIPIIPGVLKSSALFLFGVAVLAFIFVLPDATLSMPEGITLVMLFAAYVGFLYKHHREGRFREQAMQEITEPDRTLTLPGIIVLFALSLGAIILAGEFVITSATVIARSLHIPETAIAMTLVAFGTSVPEVATCVMAARKKEGALAVGNILGADIMNICWVAGASAMANDLTISRREIWFMFPAMFIMVGAMLLMLRSGYTLTRRKGFTLLGLYILYLVSFLVVFR